MLPSHPLPTPIENHANTKGGEDFLNRKKDRAVFAQDNQCLAIGTVVNVIFLFTFCFIAKELKHGHAM